MKATTVDPLKPVPVSHQGPGGGNLTGRQSSQGTSKRKRVQVLGPLLNLARSASGMGLVVTVWFPFLVRAAGRGT